ncbi:MAG: amidophosphoribosyltransferase [Anaerolineae bacterium]
MCGVAGIYAPGQDVLADMINGLFQMQHRGQDACGIALSDGERVRLHKRLGYVRKVFAKRPADDFKGFVGCGHVRYPTQGSNSRANAQPHIVETVAGPRMALCSNGDITNYHKVRAELEQRGVSFAGSNDGELILRHIAWNHFQGGMPLLDAIRSMQAEVHGAYSICLITLDRMFAVRDLHAIRPLSFGGSHGRWVVASETNALDINRVDLVGELEPGEVVEFGPQGMRRFPHPDLSALRGDWDGPAHCVFEHVYFSRPDSIAFGERSYDVRKRFGAWLAAHDTVRGDVVVPVPDSSNAVALGYAQASGLPFEFGLMRNHYIGRTFISADQPLRDDGVKLKFNPLRSVFKDKKVILVDDSIVRGTTSRKLVRMVRAAGAAELHLRIGSPITRNSCFYGVDTPSTDELIGNRMGLDEIREHLTADSVLYMSVEGVRECLANGQNFCMACFDGRYPVPITEAKQRPGC